MSHDVFIEAITEAYGSIVALGFEYILSSIDPEKEKIVENDIVNFTRPCYFRLDIPRGQDESDEDDEGSMVGDDEGSCEDDEEDKDEDDAPPVSLMMKLKSTRQLRRLPSTRLTQLLPTFRKSVSHNRGVGRRRRRRRRRSSVML